MCRGWGEAGEREWIENVVVGDLDGDVEVGGIVGGRLQAQSIFPANNRRRVFKPLRVNNTFFKAETGCCAVCVEAGEETVSGRGIVGEVCSWFVVGREDDGAGRVEAARVDGGIVGRIFERDTIPLVGQW